MPNLPAAETNAEISIWHCSPGLLASYLEACCYHGLFPSWKGQHFVLTGINTYSGYRFAFPACSASAKTTIHGLRECLIHRFGTLHIIASNQRNHFTASKMQQWAHLHEIRGSYHVPHHPEAAGLIERWNGLLKTQLQY